MDIFNDCRNYHLSCSRLRDYMTSYPHLDIIKQNDTTTAVEIMSEYLQKECETKLRVKVRQVATFSTLAYFAWKGRKEYRDKYNLETKPGYEYQIQLLHSLYVKGKRCYLKLKQRFNNLTSSVDKVLSMQGFNVLCDNDTREDLKYEDIVDDEDGDDEKTIETISVTSTVDDTMTEVEYGLSLQLLLYKGMHMQIMLMLELDVKHITKKCHDDGKPELSSKLMAIGIQSLCNKIYDSEKDRIALFGHILYCKAPKESKHIPYAKYHDYTYDELCYIYSRVVMYNYAQNHTGSSITLYSAPIKYDSDMKSVLKWILDVVKHNFFQELMSYIEDNYGPSTSTLKKLFPKCTAAQIKMLKIRWQIDDSKLSTMFGHTTITRGFEVESSSEDIKIYAAYSQYVSSPLSGFISAIMSHLHS
jgi:hypothetical protein